MKELRVGRSRDNEIIIDDTSVSRNHAVLIISGNSFSIRDNNSTNGTFVNGSKIYGNFPLQHNDILKVGNVIVPWRNYINAPQNTNQHIAGNSIGMQHYPPQQSPIYRIKNNSSVINTGIFIGIIVLIFGIFLFIGNNSDEKRIVGIWECNDNCRGMRELIINDENYEHRFKWKDGSETIKGTWTINKSSKRLFLNPDNLDNIENFRFAYELKDNILFLTTVNNDGDLSTHEIELDKQR